MTGGFWTGLAVGVLLGAVVFMCWNGSWFLIDDMVARLRRPTREHAEDQAMAVANTPAGEITR